MPKDVVNQTLKDVPGLTIEMDGGRYGNRDTQA